MMKKFQAQELTILLSSLLHRMLLIMGLDLLQELKKTKQLEE